MLLTSKIMSKLNIVPVAHIPKEVVDAPVDDLKSLYKLCVAMQELCVVEHGVGLSAVQIGTPWRLFVAIKDARESSKFRYLVNCDYVPETEEKILSVEGCLSLRRHDGDFRRFKIHRYSKIRLIGKELMAEEKLNLIDVNEVHENDIAIVLQHECDHQRGVLIADIGEEIYLWS